MADAPNAPAGADNPNPEQGQGDAAPQAGEHTQDSSDNYVARTDFDAQRADLDRERSEKRELLLALQQRQTLAPEPTPDPMAAYAAEIEAGQMSPGAVQAMVRSELQAVPGIIQQTLAPVLNAAAATSAIPADIAADAVKHVMTDPRTRSAYEGAIASGNPQAAALVAEQSFKLHQAEASMQARNKEVQDERGEQRQNAGIAGSQTNASRGAGGQAEVAAAQRAASLKEATEYGQRTKNWRPYVNRALAGRIKMWIPGQAAPTDT